MSYSDVRNNVILVIIYFLDFSAPHGTKIGDNNAKICHHRLNLVIDMFDLSRYGIQYSTKTGEDHEFTIRANGPDQNDKPRGRRIHSVSDLGLSPG